MSIATSPQRIVYVLKNDENPPRYVERGFQAPFLSIFFSMFTFLVVAIRAAAFVVSA